MIKAGLAEKLPADVTLETDIPDLMKLIRSDTGEKVLCLLS